MNRWTVLFAAIILSIFVAIGCSGGGGSSVAPSADPETTSGSNNSGQIQNTNTSLLGFYDVYLNVGSQTMEVVEDRTASYTINIIPFLNQMASPASGISFGALTFNDDDPSNLKVDVEFKWTHPFPTIQQYKVYDFMGVIISNGDRVLKYSNLRAGNYGTDTFMTNADGYTRWFNPMEFTTEQIFGWAPGGIQNLKGTAKVNPFKAYGKGLTATGSLWTWLEGSNSDGVFQSAAGRTMNLEFPTTPTGDGLVFGYAAICCWEEQGTGPYTPYHREEPIAFRVALEDNVYYDGTETGGNVRAEIDIWAWGDQPDTVQVESTVLTGLETANPTGGGGANWSTYEIDIPADVSLSSREGHEMWVIAERNDLDYINIAGVSAPSSSVPLAAFYRVPMFIAAEKYNACPEVTTGVDGNAAPMRYNFETYTLEAIDDDGELITFFWTITDNQTGLPVPGFDGLPDLDGLLDVDWAAIGVTRYDTFDIDCVASDYKCDTDAPTLYVEIANSPPTIVSGVDGNNPPVGFTMTYNVDATDDDGDSLSYNWNVTEAGTGDPVPGYENVPGDGAGNLDVDFGAMGAVLGDQFNIDCDVDDGIDTSVATTLLVKVIPYADLFVSNHDDFSSEPEIGSISQPYHTIGAALSSGYAPGDVILVDKGSGPYNEQVALSYGTAMTLYGYGWYVEGRPVLENGGTYPVYIQWTNNITIRGFKIQFAPGATTYYLIYLYYAHNMTITDCWLSGETSYAYPYGIYSYYSNTLNFTNNEISDFGYSGTAYCNIRTMYIYRGYNAGHDISRNIITGIQDDSTSSSQYHYLTMLYYWPNGSKFNNNLIHHIVPDPGSNMYVYIYGIYMFYPYATCYVANNTMDYFSYENVTYPYCSMYGMYIYDYSSYHANTHSNILTRFYKNPSYTTQYVYGIYAYDMSNYCDVWDFPYGANRYWLAPEGPNSINADPLFVESDTEPYDYTLESGSPCIGSGFGGKDMGAYGNLQTGQTVGLLTPKT